MCNVPRPKGPTTTVLTINKCGDRFVVKMQPSPEYREGLLGQGSGKQHFACFLGEMANFWLERRRKNSSYGFSILMHTVSRCRMDIKKKEGMFTDFSYLIFSLFVCAGALGLFLWFSSLGFGKYHFSLPKSSSSHSWGKHTSIAA